MKSSFLPILAIMALAAVSVSGQEKPQGTAFDKVFEDVRTAGTDEIHSMVVLKDGVKVFERYSPGQDEDTFHILWSASKTFTATAIGFAVQDGLLSVDDKVCSFFSDDELPAERPEYLKELAVRHLLTMSSGFTRDIMGPVEAGQIAEPARTVLAQQQRFEPGTDFRYNSMNTYLLSAIVTKVTGMTAEKYLEKKLFKPLGIKRHVWEVSPEGYNMGGWGLHLTTRDLAKVGQFFLQRGQWKGKRLLSEAWFDEAMSVKIQTSMMTNGVEWQQGYGYQMWQCTVPGVFRMDGAWGQFCIIIPDKNAVIACNCHTNHPDVALKSIFDNAYNAL